MNKSSFSTKKLTLLSMLTAVAMLLSYVESLVPPFVAIPGVKLGLSNIATVLTLYTLGIPAAIAVSFVRVCLSSLLFGNVQILFFSLMGAAFALITMSVMKKLTPFSVIGVSVAGGVMHNVGQIVAACIVMENAAIASYLPPLIVTGTLAGVAVGAAAAALVGRLSSIINKHSK